jgi:hypothetical protein
MARGGVRIWYDREGDYLEVMFDLATLGYFLNTEDGRVMEKIDAAGNVQGFSIHRVSVLREASLEISAVERCIRPRGTTPTTSPANCSRTMVGTRGRLLTAACPPARRRARSIG